MKIRGHGNGLAIALSAVAVVFAASGTAYAVSATVVNIADPTTPSRVAKVDPAGRLNTVGAVSSINIVSTVYTNSSRNADLFSSPTNATLAVTKFSVTPPNSIAGAYGVYFFQVPVNSDGTCSVSVTARTLGYATVTPGVTATQDFTAPIVVAPISGAPYCLDLYVQSQSAGSEPTGVGFNMQITAYVTVGKYSGIGLQPGSGGTRAKADAVKGR